MWRGRGVGGEGVCGGDEALGVRGCVEGTWTAS